jgi:radical SAM protein with 4Fe4S-binding SPASM domain
MKIISSIASLKSYIYFTGGEPLLRNDVVSLVKHATCLGLLTHLNTNGTKLPEIAGELVGAGLNFIHISLDSIAETGALVTGVENGYEAGICGIRAMVEARKKIGSIFPRIQVFCTINRYNQDSLFKIAEEADKAGADIFVLSLPIFTSASLAGETAAELKKEFKINPVYWNGFIDDDMKIDADVVKNHVNRIKKMRRKIKFRILPAESGKHFYKTHFTQPRLAHGNINRCFLPNKVAVILPDGSIATCWDHHDYIVGNVTETCFSELWNCEKMAIFRRRVNKQIFASCPRCTGLYFKK